MCESKIRIHLDGLAALSDGFVIGVRDDKKLRQIGINDQR